MSALVIFKKQYFRIDSWIKLSRKRKKQPNASIKVLFVCQFLPAWDKIKNLYFEINKDDCFSCSILCVPSKISAKDNDTYMAIVKQGYQKSNVINALNNSGSYLKLKSLKYDLIFYDRPYNNYLPREYHARIAAKYGAVCFHSYALGLSKRLHEALMYDDFYLYIKYYFAESRDTLSLFSKKYSSKRQYQHGLFLGYLGIENAYAQRALQTNIWDFAGNNYKIIWTPRWSTDMIGGGSNFLKYKNSFFKMLDIERFALLIRPHPLMINNFLKSGLLSKEDANSFFEMIEKSEKINYDSSSQYIPTFWNSDVLVTDFSSIIAEYIITEKPIIFCNSGIDWDFFPFAKELISCCYVADNFMDIQKQLINLKKGIDPYLEKRKAFIRKYYFNEYRYASNKIHDYLKTIFEVKK